MNRRLTPAALSLRLRAGTDPAKAPTGGTTTGGIVPGRRTGGVAVGCALAIVALTLSGCGATATVADTPASDEAPVRASTSTSTGTGAPTEGQATASAAAQTRSPQDLKAALIALEDMPAGFAVDPSAASGPSPQASTTDPGCTAFVAIENPKAAPGSTGHEEISFLGGQNGPFIRETIDAFATAGRATDFLDQDRAAVASCKQATLTFPRAAGTSTVTLTPVTPPAEGDHPVATRLTGHGGPWDRVEIVEVRTGVDNTVVTLSFLATAASDIQGGAGLAVRKARSGLGVAPTATS